MPTVDFENQLDNHLSNIEESDDINPRNKELIMEYKRDQVLNGLSDATLVRNLSRMKLISEYVEQPFDEMTKSDVKDLLEWVHSQDYKQGTIYTYKNVIRSFWTWMNPSSDGEAPEEVSWIKYNSSNGSGKLPKDLLTKEDIENQISVCKNERDKALIAMLYESGARIGELIDLKVGDIEDRKHGKKVVFDGKTGERRIPLVECVPYLNRWLNVHPNSEKSAPLWCKLQRDAGEKPLGYRYIRKILDKTMTEAGIDKPSNPHHYRHSRASYLANHLKEAQLNSYMGWVQGSDVPAKYVHLSGRDIDDAIDQIHGLYEPEEEDEPDVVECARCNELNEPGAQFCMRCGFALDIDAAEEVETAEGNMEKDLGGVDTEDVLEALLESYDGDTEQLLSRVKG